MDGEIFNESRGMMHSEGIKLILPGTKAFNDATEEMQLASLMEYADESRQHLGGDVRAYESLRNSIAQVVNNRLLSYEIATMREQPRRPRPFYCTDTSFLVSGLTYSWVKLPLMQALLKASMEYGSYLKQTGAKFWRIFIVDDPATVLMQHFHEGSKFESHFTKLIRQQSAAGVEVGICSATVLSTRYPEHKRDFYLLIIASSSNGVIVGSSCCV